MIAPSRDEFEAWKADPVTQFVMAGLLNLAGAQKAAWVSMAWEAGDLSELTRERHRVRAGCYAELAGLIVDDAYGANGLEPPPAPKPEPEDDA